MGKFSKQFDCFQIVSTSSFFGGVESADIDERVLESYSGSPRPVSSDLRTKRHAFVFSPFFVLLMVLAIGEILAHGAWSEISIAIIQTVAVAVVYVGAISIYYFSMHSSCGFGVLIDRIPSLTTPVEVCLPSPIRQAKVSMIGNDCTLSVCKPDISTRLAVNVYDFFRNSCVFGIPFTLSAKAASFGFKCSTIRAMIVLVGTLFGWCKIGWWLGNSFGRAHILSTTEMCGRATTEIIVLQLEVV
jgi:hypothetical protein